MNAQAPKVATWLATMIIVSLVSLLARPLMVLVGGLAGSRKQYGSSGGRQ